MRILVIGGTGHIGTYLVPRLVRSGHQVGVLTRGERRPYRDDEAWGDVEMITCDRSRAEADGGFGALVAQWRPEAVHDLTCFTVAQARQLTDALDGQLLVQTGSIWSWGPSEVVPTTEQSPRYPTDEYGTNKAAVQDFLLGEQQRVRAAVVHPGHISGPGWVAVNPAGNLDLEVYRSLRRDGSVTLPERGLGMLQHVHADDVARLHQRVMDQPEASVGEAFNAVCEQSLTLRGYAGLLAARAGHELRARYLPWDDFAAEAGEHAAATAEHIGRSPHHSMAKARELLGFVPQYTAPQTVLAAFDALVASQTV